MAVQGQWFGLETFLIDYISGSYFSSEVSMNSNKFSPVNEPLDLHFGPEKGKKSVKSLKNGGSRSIIWIKNDFDQLY